MAKELPYFKFEPSEWDNGNIQMCSRESKGLFIDLCSIYWSRLGELPYALALQKHCNGNKAALQELVDHEIFGVIEGQIVIEFLDEQLAEFNQTSEKRRNAANKRWKDASALQMQSKSNAIRVEKKRGEREIVTHGEGKISITVRKVFANDNIHKIFDLKKYFEFTEQVGSLEEKGWIHYDAFMQANAAKSFNEPDHLYNTFRNFCIEFKLPVNGTKYKNAELDKDLWTLEAWEKQYDYYLKNDNGFRKHFGYEEL